MKDGRSYRFSVADGEFREDGGQSQVELLKEILSSYPDAEIVCYDQGRIPEIVRDQGYSPEDQLILEELFGLR